MARNEGHTVKFLRNGITIVEKDGRRTVVGQVTKNGSSIMGYPSYWTLKAYVNGPSDQARMYNGERRQDLVPYAIAVYKMILDEAGISSFER